MILLYSAIIAICLAISRTSIRVLPYAMITSGYYIFYMIVYGHFSHTNETALYWITVDTLAFIFMRARNGVDYICNRNILFLLIMLLLIILANSFFVSQMTQLTIKKIFFVIIIAYTPYLISIYVKSSDNNPLISAVSSLAFAMNIITFVSFAMSTNHYQRFTFIPDWPPINSAVVSSVGALSSAWLISNNKNKSYTIILFHFFSIFLSLITILVTSERGPLVFLLFVFVVLPPFPIKIFSVKRVGLVLSLASLILIAFFLNPNSRANKRILLLFDPPSHVSTPSSAKTTVQQRIDRYKVSFDRGADKPFTGIGFASSPEGIYAHNSVLELFEELGLFGALTFVSVLVAASFSIYRRRSLNLTHSLNCSSYFWDSMLLFATLESFVSFTIFAFPLFWLSLGMATRRHTSEVKELEA